MNCSAFRAKVEIGLEEENPPTQYFRLHSANRTGFEDTSCDPGAVNSLNQVYLPLLSSLWNMAVL
jgi:hypothetical protein